MLTHDARKEAIRKFKERKPNRGIYVVHCSATGNWVGSSRNLDATRNGIWFSLRLGSHREKSLQEEFSRQGEPAFEYQVVERLDEDVAALGVADLLKEKASLWTGQLGARMLQPS